MKFRNSVSNYQSPLDYSHKSVKASKSLTDFFEHPDGYFLPHKFTRKLHGTIFNRMYEIEVDSTYSLKGVCGKEYWKSLSKQERHLAYNCVDFLIEHEGLRLQLMKCNNKKYYLFSFDLDNLAKLNNSDNSD